VIDWSGGNDTGPRPRRDAIWAGAVIGGTEIDPVYIRNRDAARDWIAGLIASELAANRRLFVGFDFPFGYPEGFSAAVTGSADPLRLWDWFAANLTDTPRGNTRFALAGWLNTRFPGVGPFWFNGTAHDIPDLPRKGRDRKGHGLPERRRAETLAKGAFPCWQMGGAGAVGGQVMTGMAQLARLRAAFPEQIAVWPFEPQDRPVSFVEIWPSLIASAVREAADPIRDRAQVRLLSRALSRLPPERLAAMMEVNAPEEGWILGAGHETELLDTLTQ
jgi:molybdopterin molybdotransferase